MAFFNFKNIKVAGVACAVPSNEVKTESYKPLFGDVEVDKFMAMTGVRASRRTSEYQTCSDLGYRAAKELLKKNGISSEEIGALLFVSHSPDYRRPSTAFVLQYRLGIPKEAVCYDISLGCSSLVVGMQTIASIMTTSDIKRALVVVGDGNGVVGFGMGKSNEVPDAIRKGLEDAKKNLVKISLKGTTIPHEIVGKFGAGAVLMKPAPEGTGVIAGGPVRAVVEMAGIKNIRTKSLRSNNPCNVVRATMAGLTALRDAQQVAELRGKSVKEILG